MEELTKKIGLQYTKFRQADSEWRAAHFANELPSYRLREHLREAIGHLLSGRSQRGQRLAVFIDDVDRCEPEAAYRLLEGLKVYLTLDNCVFILGMNQKAVENAIGHRLAASTSLANRPNPTEAADDRIGRKTSRADTSASSQIAVDDETSSRAAAYMEKLCQNVWRLPTVRNPDRVLHGFLAQTPGLDNSMVERLGQAVSGQCLPPNPRRLKGLANLIVRLLPRLPDLRTLPTELAIREIHLLVIVAYIYQFHHEIYVRWEAEPDLYRYIYERCRGELGLAFLSGLVLPRREIDTNPTAPTQQNQFESTYPDPTESRVFWIQPLIVALGREVEPATFKRYLHGES